MILMPSMDLRAGRCVRLREGDFATEKAYGIAPAHLLQRYQALGARWLHIVDLDGAKDALTLNLPIIERLAQHPSICLQVGGGVRNPAVIERLLSLGVSRVVIGSAAARQPAEVAAWVRWHGAERVCVAFDVKIGPEGEAQVHTDGWTVNSSLSLWNALAALEGCPLKHVLCTDIGRDGTLKGPNFALYRAALARFPRLAWQASGGIRSATDLGALQRIGVAVAISGTALIEEHIPLKELRQFLPDASSPASTYVQAKS